MSESQPIDISEHMRARVLEQVHLAHFTASIIAELELPLTPERGNALLRSRRLTLEEYRALTKQIPDLKDPARRSALLKIQDARNANVGLMAEFGAALIQQGKPEGIPIVLATGRFSNDEFQDALISQEEFSNKYEELISRAFDFEEHGGAVVFPTLSDEKSTIVAVQRENDIPRFRDYTGRALTTLILSQTTPARIAYEMIRVARHS